MGRQVYWYRAGAQDMTLASAARALSVGAARLPCFLMQADSGRAKARLSGHFANIYDARVRYGSPAPAF